MLRASTSPAIEVHAGENGAALMRRLLSMVPDVLSFDGLDATVIYPREEDEPDYRLVTPAPHSRGVDGHYILYGAWGKGGKGENRVTVIGTDEEGNMICGAAADDADIADVGERLDIRIEQGVKGAEDSQSLACAALSRARLEYSSGYLVMPPHCGMELWDVIEVNNELASPATSRFRVTGYSLLYDAIAGIFQQRLNVGEV